jgi:Protein of unknown function (DUF3892)
MVPVMPLDIQVSYKIPKPNNPGDPLKGLEGLGGVHDGSEWFLSEKEIIAELHKPEIMRKWNFYVDTGGEAAKVVLARRKGREYLKTMPDSHREDTLLRLPEKH